MPNQPTRVLAASLVAALLVFGSGAVVWLALSLHRIVLQNYHAHRPVKDEAGVIAIGEQFGEAVQKENYVAAYELLSATRKAEQSLEQFTATTKQHRLEYLGTEKIEVTVHTWGPSMEEFDYYSRSDFPSDVTYDALLGSAIVNLTWAAPDSEGVLQARWITLDVLVVDEAGRPKIGHIDWADDF